MSLSLFCRRNCPFIANQSASIVKLAGASCSLCFCRVQNSLRVVGNHVPVEWIGQSVKGRACWPGTTCSMARTTDSCELYSWRRVRHTTTPVQRLRYSMCAHAHTCTPLHTPTHTHTPAPAPTPTHTRALAHTHALQRTHTHTSPTTHL